MAEQAAWAVCLEKPEPTAEQRVAEELVRRAREQGLSLTDPDGLLKQLTKSVLETALNQELTEHLGHEKHSQPAAGSGNVRNGTRPKTVITKAGGEVGIDVPRDRAGTFEPQIVRKRQWRLTGVDEMVLSLYAKGLTTGADIADLGEEHGHRVLRVCGKGTRVVLVSLPPAVGRAIDQAIGPRVRGPILLNSRGARMDRHAATRRLKRLAEAAGVRISRPHPHMLRHTFVTTMLDARVDLRDVQIAARHADPRTTMRYDRARKNLDRHPNHNLAAYMASGT